jgi:hypothetical protein
MTWFLIVKTVHGEHRIALDQSEADALVALSEVQRQIGRTGIARIADRLVVKAEDITAGLIDYRTP